jgi:hypothetical protein
MSWITLSQVERVDQKDPPDVTEYEVTTRVALCGGIEPEIFVMETSTDSFQHVALVADMLSWPSSRDAAVAAYKPYYRVSAFYRSFTLKSKAIEFAADVRRRTEILNNAWSADVDGSFGGETTYTYEAGT